jgi:hypothetical protein
MDFVATRIGENIQVEFNDEFSLIFTPSAIEELIRDYENIKTARMNAVKNKEHNVEPHLPDEKRGYPSRRNAEL